WRLLSDSVLGPTFSVIAPEYAAHYRRLRSLLSTNAATPAGFRQARQNESRSFSYPAPASRPHTRRALPRARENRAAHSSTPSRSPVPGSARAHQRVAPRSDPHTAPA